MDDNPPRLEKNTCRRGTRQRHTPAERAGPDSGGMNDDERAAPLTEHARVTRFRTDKRRGAPVSRVFYVVRSLGSLDLDLSMSDFVWKRRWKPKAHDTTQPTEAQS